MRYIISTVILEFVVKHGQPKAKPTVKAKIVKKPDKVLTNDEILQHPSEVKAAIKAELALWIKYGIMSRTAWTGARNIVTSRFVYEWKVVDDTKTIRARLVLHGHQNSSRKDFIQSNDT